MHIRQKKEWYESAIQNMEYQRKCATQKQLPQLAVS